MSVTRIHQLSNAGILVESGRHCFAIDALHGKLAPYYGTPPQVFDGLIDAIPPFEKLSGMIITHEHWDHFSLDAVTAFCRNRPHVPIISTSAVIERLEQRLPLATNLIAVNPQPHQEQTVTVDGVRIQCMRLTHAGKGYEDVCNLACVLHTECVVAHMGDSEGDGANIKAFSSIFPQGGVLCAPFPHLTLPRTFGLIRAMLPGLLYVVHMPDPVEDRFGWLRAIHKANAVIHDMPIVLGGTPGLITSVDALLR